MVRVHRVFWYLVRSGGLSALRDASGRPVAGLPVVGRARALEGLVVSHGWCIVYLVGMWRVVGVLH